MENSKTDCDSHSKMLWCSELWSPLVPSDHACSSENEVESVGDDSVGLRLISGLSGRVCNVQSVIDIRL